MRTRDTPQHPPYGARTQEYAHNATRGCPTQIGRLGRSGARQLQRALPQAELPHLVTKESIAAKSSFAALDRGWTSFIATPRAEAAAAICCSLCCPTSERATFGSPDVSTAESKIVRNCWSSLLPGESIPSFRPSSPSTALSCGRQPVRRVAHAFMLSTITSWLSVVSNANSTAAVPDMLSL
ncbi:hypothetical protein LMG24235_07887 [Paraburkholderia sabiae]|nr:hypothetical protein LMG24235_07887 [Paraburkholderia sabiae]